MSTRTAFFATAGISFLGCLVFSGVGRTAEIKLLSVNGVKLILSEVISSFEQGSGHKVTVALGEAGILRKRVEDGEPFDVAILPRPATDALMKQNKIEPESAVDVVRAPFGIGARAGTPGPDTSSLDAFKRSLLAANRLCIPTRRRGE